MVREVGPDENPYAGLRNLALHSQISKLAPDLALDQSGVFGLLMDWGLEKGVATLVAYLTGDASLYFSSGGGVIGGFAHANVRRSASAWIELAKLRPQEFGETGESDLPQSGQVRFYLLRSAGLGSVSTTVEEIAAQQHPLSPVWIAAQQLIHELRMISAIPETECGAAESGQPSNNGSRKPWWQFWR